MSRIHRRLPDTPTRWQTAVEENELDGLTAHTAEFASASKMDYKQFLLLRVLWKVHTIHAEELLGGSQAWANYCRDIENAENSEGSYSIARHYQIKAANNKGRIGPDSFDTPVAKRTRYQARMGDQARKGDKARKNLMSEFKKLQIGTTPSQNPLPDITASDDFLITESPPPSPTPITPAGQVPGDLQKLIFPPTKDEQIVNTALVVFLNALTIHFDAIEHCDWTMHRKALVAEFEQAQFGSRTDGYLDDGNSNPYALIEVKPIVRAFMDEWQIQIQESAQMIGLITNDINAPVNKLRVHCPRIGTKSSSSLRNTIAVICLICKRSQQTTNLFHS